MRPAPELLDRFARDLDALIARDARIGVAVSGGPDSLALLLLSAAARPGLVEAATVDHGLRPEAREEAEMVAALCKRLGVPHATLTAEWGDKPETAIQERARAERYRLLGNWVKHRGLAGLVTAHHLDDQVETFVMRLTRGAGVKGLAGMRPVAAIPGSELALVRPLLGWRRSELEQLCADAGVEPISDPSNSDAQFERVRVRRGLAEVDGFDVEAAARSAAHLADADAALAWAVTEEWKRAVTASDAEIVYRPDDAPREILRRVASRAVTALASEGEGAELRGRELDRLLETLCSGRSTTLRGVLCRGGTEWRFIPAPNRTRRGRNLR
ncbi:MAG: tRNA lysidine(34) synthetase TilS [Sphingomicrobium sp.]